MTARAAHAVEEKRPRRPRPLLIALGSLLAVLLVIAGAAGLYLQAIRHSFNDNVTRGDSMPTYAGRPTPAGDALNYVLMGTDTRDAEVERGRSDALMLVHVDADRRNIYIVSYPRDMWVEIPDHGKAKINAAYSWGGLPLTVRTMELLNDVPVDHIAMIDFEGFQDLTSELGGVTVVNPHESTNGPFHYPAGEITLEGEQALMYVRERYDLPNGDFDRAERQRTVVQAILKKMAEPETLANPARFTQVVGTFSKYLTVDAGLTDQVITETVTGLRVSPNSIHILQAPIAGTGRSSDGQAIDLVDEQGMVELRKALHDDTMDQYVKEHPNG